MLVGVGDHLASPEVAVPTGDAEEQGHRRDGGFAHGEVYLGEHLELAGAVHDRRLFDLAGHALKGVAQQADVHGRHTHGNDHQPLVVGDAQGIENGLGAQVVQILGNDTCGKPHGENQEEVEELVEEADETDEVEELAEEVDELEEEVEDLAEEEVDELEEEVEDLAEEEVDELAEESDDEIEELQGVDEFDSILKMLGGAMRYEYKPSDETYFASEDFPIVDNLFGEELYLGDRDRRINTKEYPIKVYPLPEYMEETPAEEVIEETPVSEETPVEEIEEKASADDDFIDADIIDEPLLEEKTELPPESNEAELEEAEEVEEAEESEASEEEIPALDSATDFLLAGFAENISESTPELEAALAVPKAPENTIIEKDGVYSIAENLEYTNIVQDAEFKELVDSIL